jgi:glycosyltransferase 2 family protein
MQILKQLWRRVWAFARKHSKPLLFIGGILLVFYVFIPQLSSLKESLQAAESANKVLLTLAIIIFAVGFPIISGKYYLISRYPLKYKLTLKVQTASAFVAKLLPMSIGSLTVNTYYLSRESKSVTAAASTMTFNAATSTISYAIIVIAAIIGSWGSFSTQNVQKNLTWYEVLGIILIITLILWGLMRINAIRSRVKKGAKGLWTDLKTYKQQPIKVTWGVLFNGLGTLTGIATLYICCHAVGLKVNFAQTVLAYTLGNIVGSLVPTPGGLGGVEAGLYSGLIFFGYEADSSLVAVLLYRLISYWIPIIPGYVMYHSLRKTVLKDFRIHSKPAKA